MRVVIACLLGIVGAAGARAGTVVLTLDHVTVVEPGVTWTEGDVDLWFSATTDEDALPGDCAFKPHVGANVLLGVFLCPARLNVDLSGVLGLWSVEVDVSEAGAAGDTRVFLYSGGTLVDYDESGAIQGSPLVVRAGRDAVDRVAISGRQGIVWEIRLFGWSIVPAETTAFGAVKALYR